MWEHVFYYNLGLRSLFGFGLACRILREGFVYETGKGGFGLGEAAVFVVFVVLVATDGLQTLICLTLLSCLRILPSF